MIQALNERALFPFFSTPRCLCLFIPILHHIDLLRCCYRRWLFLWHDWMFSIMLSALCDSWPVMPFYCFCLINFLISHLLNFRTGLALLRSVPVITMIQEVLCSRGWWLCLGYLEEDWGLKWQIWWHVVDYNPPPPSFAQTISCHYPLMVLCVWPHQDDKWLGDADVTSMSVVKYIISCS